MLPLLSSMLVGLAEKLLNPILQLDSATTQGLQKLQGKQLAFALAGMPFRLVLTAQADGLWLNQHQEPVDCAVTLNWRALPHLQDPSQLTRLIRDGQLQIDGDMATLQKFSQFFSQLDPDWDEVLVPYLGDAGAHQIGKALRQTFTAVRAHFHQSELALQELLQDELRVSPVQAELAHFSQQVSQLSGRAEQLQRQLQQLTHGPRR